jgi:hypothetical protein
VLNHRDEVVWTVATPVAFREPGIIDVRVPLDRLPPGAYRLRAAAEAGEHRAERVVGIVVR